MLRINRQTDYAVRVVLALARRPGGTRLSTSEIRDEMLIPSALSQRIVAQLVRSGFIDSFPGRDGGVQLSRPTKDINLLQIVEQFEGPICISDCFIEDTNCPFEEQCPVRHRWSPLQDIIRKELEKITFEDLAADATLIEHQTKKLKSK